ncbi:MAG TPA: hypothetical protein PKE04_08760 [Clostridia bacterium]|nr:hypothetical protein [Clostridia bacterium]
MGYGMVKCRNGKLPRTAALALLLCLLLVRGTALAPAFAETSAGCKPVSPNPRENVPLLEAEIERFRLQVLPQLEGKNAQEATDIFFEQVEALYDAVGQPFKWPHAHWYHFMEYWIARNVVFPRNASLVVGLPGPEDLTEKAAIGIAKRTVLLLSDMSSEALDALWVSTSYTKSSPKHPFSWDIDFVVETPGETAPYYIRFMLSVDPRTGHITSFFDSRSNDI